MAADFSRRIFLKATTAAAAATYTTRIMPAWATDGEPILDPAVYHHVAQVIWVVSDIDRVVDYWRRLGVRHIHRDGVVSFPSLTYRGKPDPARAKQVTANVDELEIKWIQPVHGGKFWRDGLRQHGDGIRVLGYTVRSPQEFDDQIKYFSSKGVGVVVQDSWRGKTGQGRIAYLDTAAPGGGHTLALIYDPDADPDTRSRAAAGPGNEYPVTKITHFAWVVNDVRKVDAYYTGLGFKPFSRIDHNVSLDRIYRGQPGTYEMWLGWDRTGDAREPVETDPATAGGELDPCDRRGGGGDAAGVGRVEVAGGAHAAEYYSG